MEKKKNNLEPVHQNRRSANPSFSSTLLESIYRSIDEKGGTEKPETLDEEIIMSSSFYHSMKKKHNFSNNATAVLSNSNSNSSSSSSESSFWSGGLSSSDSESAHYYYGSSKSRSSSCYSYMQRPKPIRTERSSSYGASKNNHEQDKAKMMSKALKIYNELKKVKKQPISPGGKLSSFLNSLFAHPKKPKNKPEPSIISKSSTCNNSYTPNCSSASSYTRSCLSKTPSSKLSNNGSKRSVRFFPVSVIVDQDSQPCGHKKLYHEEEDDHDDELRVVRVMEENRKVAEAAKKLLESCRKPKKESYGGGDDDDDDDDDDRMSCASSDLFELNNLSMDIGSGRYSEELPVYETTHVDTNRAIANGLIV